eukprot:gene11788-10202_t
MIASLGSPRGVLLVAAAAAAAQAAPGPGTLIPLRPSPYFSWDTIPVSHHGANMSGPYTDAALDVLSRVQMITI